MPWFASKMKMSGRIFFVSSQVCAPKAEGSGRAIRLRKLSRLHSRGAWLSGTVACLLDLRGGWCSRRKNLEQGALPSVFQVKRHKTLEQGALPPVFQVCRNKTPAQGALPPVFRVYVSAMSLTNEVINGENGVMTVVPSNALRQLKNCIAVHQAWKEAEEDSEYDEHVPLKEMEWGAVQQWTNCCTDFVPKIMLTGFLTYAEHECKGQFDKPEL